MAGPCDCNDEETKDMKCCGCLDSYCWFKVLAWIQMVVFIIEGIMFFLLIAVVVAAHQMAKDAAEGNPDAAETQAEIDMQDFPVALIYIVLVLLVIGIVGSIAFVCCDSAQTRKLYAVTTLLGSAAGLLISQEPQQIVSAILGCYFAYEINRLAEAAKRGTQAQVQQFM